MTTDFETPAVPPGPAGRAYDDEISLWEVLAVLLRRRGTIVAATVVVMALAVVFALTRPDTYTTQALFRPQGSEASASELMALASQFGVRIPGGGSGEEVSPAFYAELLVSREILYRIASEPYEVAGEGTTTLQDLFEIEEDTEDMRVEEMIEVLREEVLSTSTGRETGVVTLEVTTEWPDLSQEITRRLLDQIALFNLSTRQSQAGAERAFIQERVDSARHALTQAEGALEEFLLANRTVQGSPVLEFQRDALQREVTLAQQVYTTLVQSFEQARISEVRDTPVITVLQAPFLPPGPDESRLLLFAALGVVLGGMGGVVLAFVLEAVRRPAEGDPAREDFQRAWDAVVGSLPFVGRRTA